MNKVFLISGPVVFVLTLLLPAPATLTVEGWHVAGVACWMAVWWLSGVIPLEATALLPILLFPLVGVGTIEEATAPYADPIIFLFLGGFLMAATLERWDLHKRFALGTVRIAGVSGPRVVLAFMAAAAALSMWISNTATAVMMLPIAKAVTAGLEHEDVAARESFSTALLLSVAYACSIGGVTTLIGTPPNAIFAASARELVGVEIGFGEWIFIGASVSVPMFFLCWIVLVRLFRVRGELPGLAAIVSEHATQLGRMRGAERFILSVLAVTAAAWILRAPKNIGGARIPGLTDVLPGISDAAIAIGAAMILLSVPLPRSRYSVALDWRTASKIPWGILLLFGGGLSLASAFASSGLTEWIGGSLQQLSSAPMPVIILATVLLFVLLTEMTSNAATTALGMPLMVGVASGLGRPALPLMIAATLAASMAFMLPVATPPNAIVFGSGMIKPIDMARAGARLNVVAVFVITLVVVFLRS